MAGGRAAELSDARGMIRSRPGQGVPAVGAAAGFLSMSQCGAEAPGTFPWQQPIPAAAVLEVWPARFGKFANALGLAVNCRRSSLSSDLTVDAEPWPAMSHRVWPGPVAEAVADTTTTVANAAVAMIWSFFMLNRLRSISG